MFSTYAFSNSATIVMDTFNLRYKCLDECDDCTAQFKKIPTVPGSIYTNTDYIVDTIPNEFYNGDIVDDMDTSEYVLGSYGLQTIQHM